MGHDEPRDCEHLGMALATRAHYIGVVGPRSRTERLLADLGREPEPRLHAPAGLDDDPASPQERALAILAGIQAALRHAPAPSPRELPDPVTERPTTSRPAVAHAAMAAS